MLAFRMVSPPCRHAATIHTGDLPCPQPNDARRAVPAERQKLRQHVINSRNGRLAASGTFVSTPEDVERIFAEHIRTFAQGQESGAPLLLFFAHGNPVAVNIAWRSRPTARCGPGVRTSLINWVMGPRSDGSTPLQIQNLSGSRPTRPAPGEVRP
jgi:hypothetical protein